MKSLLKIGQQLARKFTKYSISLDKQQTRKRIKPHSTNQVSGVTFAKVHRSKNVACCSRHLACYYGIGTNHSIRLWLVSIPRLSYNKRVIGMTTPCLSFAFDGKLSAIPLGVAFGSAGWVAYENAYIRVTKQIGSALSKWVGQLHIFNYGGFNYGNYHSRWN